MYSPSRKVRASVRRTLHLLLIGFVSGLLLIEAIIEIKRNFIENQFTPTHSADLMLNRSQMLLAKETILEPTIFTCQSKLNTNSSNLYPLYIIVKTRAVSSGEYFERRMFTRISWGREAHSYGIPVIYAIGRTQDNQTQKRLENEHKSYGDLLQFNYIDAYYNITIKSTGILHWFVKHGCEHVTPYLFVVDDDVLINIPSLLKIVSKKSLNLNTLYGSYVTDIETHPSGGWGVNLIDFSNRTYPSFLLGTSVLYPTSVIKPISQRIFQLVDENKSIFFLDDVFITGIISEELSIKRELMLGIDICSETDLLPRIVIGDCNKIRRTYIWTKFILSRMGYNTDRIDRLISKTTYTKWVGNFKQMGNGTTFIQKHKFNHSILSILTGYHPKISLLLLFILLFLFISIFIPKLITLKQSTSTLPLASCRSNSARLLTPIRN